MSKKKNKVNERVPEGGAIENEDGLSMEQYSEIMKKNLEKEYLRFIENLMDSIEIPENAKILEVGSGPGWIGIWLAKKRGDISVDALEPSNDMRNAAKKNAESEGVADRVHYIEGFVEYMEKINTDHYDVVFSRDSLHHWENPVSGFKEISRVVKNNGNIFIRDSKRNLNLGGKIIVNVFGRIFAGSMFKYWQSSINASYTPDEIREFFSQFDSNGWDVESSLLDLTISKL